MICLLLSILFYVYKSSLQRVYKPCLHAISKYVWIMQQCYVNNMNIMHKFTKSKE